MPPKISFQMDKATKAVLKASRDLLTVGELSFAAGIAADIIAEEAKRLVPVKTGRLKSAIVSRTDKARVQFGGGRGAAYVGANYGIAPHAHLVEYGAKGGRMPAQPFMRAAIENKQGEAMAALEADIAARIIKKLGGV